MTKKDYIEKITQNLEHLTKDELKDVSILTTAQYGVRSKFAERQQLEHEIANLTPQLQQQALSVVPSDTDKLSVEKLQEIRVEELKDFNLTILKAELENQKLQKQLDSCIQTLIEASASATITQDIVVGNLVDRKLAGLAKTHKLAVDYIEKVTGKNIDVVLAENAALEAEEEE